MLEPHKKGGSELERLLAALPPRPTALDRDHLLFRAGQASMKRSWVWPFLAVAMSVACGCLAMVLVLRPAAVVRTVHLAVPAPAPAVGDNVPRGAAPAEAPNYLGDTPSPDLSYWRMQHQALRFGVEGLPQPTWEVNEMPESAVAHSPSYSAGSRPGVTDHASSFLSFGER